MSDHPTPSERYRQPLQDALGGECVRCGQENKLEIHHKDGDSNNSDFNNLALLCESCHHREHYDTVSNNDATNDIDIKELAKLVEKTTAARGVDLFAVERCGLSAADWARLTDRDRSTVARNVRRGTEDR
jgi:hypothetical protein